MSTANSLPVLDALDKHDLPGQVKVITTDLFPDLIPHIESGRVMATLSQRPVAQGKTAMEGLLRYLLEDVAPASVTRLTPHIVLRSNLSLYAEAEGKSGSR